MSLDIGILKTIISNKKIAIEFVNDYDSRLFSPEVWSFAQVIVAYVKTYRDLPTQRIIKEKLEKNNNLKFIETIEKTWNEVSSYSYDEKEYKHDLEKLKKRFSEKQLILLKEDLSKLDNSQIDIEKTLKSINKTNQEIKNITKSKSFTRQTMKDYLPTFRQDYRAKLENPEFDKGIQTKYSYLDYVTDGLRPGELIIVGGESSSGKSLLLNNLAIQMWLQENNPLFNNGTFTNGNSILYFSLEMPYKPCLNRCLARLSSNPMKKIRNATLNEEEGLRLKQSLKFIKEYPYEFEIVDVPRGATMENIEFMFEEAKAFYEPKVVVIDYLGLLEYENPNLEDWLKLEKISEKMHEFARVHNVIVLSAVQLNRMKPGKEVEERVGLHRIGRSAGIIKNANIGIQIYTRMNEKQYPDMEYYVIKNRDGELGKGRLLKNLKCATLTDDDNYIEDANIDDISERMVNIEI